MSTSIEPHERIHADTGVGPVSITVSDLARAEQFYRDVLGLRTTQRGNGTIALAPAAPAAPILELVEQRGARRQPHRSTGLYHFAILVPERADLARALVRLLEHGWPLQGAADHGVSEALYLADPDGNGIEVYRDRPRDEWPRRGAEVAMVTDPLDLAGLAATAASDTRDDPVTPGLPTGTRMGHVHLRVADLRDAERFYHGVLGFDVTQRSFPGALFLSAGGYHHHIGLNTWSGVGAPPPPAEAVGLRHFVIDVPTREALAALAARLHEAGFEAEPRAGAVFTRDPSGNGVTITTREPERSGEHDVGTA